MRRPGNETDDKAMGELEKMRTGLRYDYSSAEVQQSYIRCKSLLKAFNLITEYDPEYRQLLDKLIPRVPASTVVIPPFHCDHGHGILFGESVYVNHDCCFSDSGAIRIGSRTLIGPNVQIHTSQHPTSYILRRQPKETAHPVTIGEDCWIGGGAIILPGVKIGNRCIIGAGSLVLKDVPDDCLAAGNPAVIKKSYAS